MYSSLHKMEITKLRCCQLNITYGRQRFEFMIRMEIENGTAFVQIALWYVKFDFSLLQYRYCNIHILLYII